MQAARPDHLAGAGARRLAVVEDVVDPGGAEVERLLLAHRREVVVGHGRRRPRPPPRPAPARSAGSQPAIARVRPHPPSSRPTGRPGARRSARRRRRRRRPARPAGCRRATGSPAGRPRGPGRRSCRWPGRRGRGRCRGSRETPPATPASSGPLVSAQTTYRSFMVTPNGEAALLSWKLWPSAVNSAAAPAVVDRDHVPGVRRGTEITAPSSWPTCAGPGRRAARRRPGRRRCRCRPCRRRCRGR